MLLMLGNRNSPKLFGIGISNRMNPNADPSNKPSFSPFGIEPPLNPLLKKEGSFFPLLFKERIKVRLTKGTQIRILKSLIFGRKLI